jgi:phage repressor protein C with HTH and peptisase S24 domain
LIEQGNCVFIGGKTFVVSYQKDDFFSNDSHNIALYLKNYAPTRLNQLSLVTCVKKSLGHKYTWGDSVSKAKINKDTIMLPVCADGETPDLATMEQIVAAVQKIVIADVAKYTARNLEATQQVIEAQEEPEVEQKITLIHPEYQPGFIPLYTLRAACGYFGEGRLPEEEGWIDASCLGFTPDPKRHFAVHAKGDSMLPKIKDGDICIFEWYNAGSRNGEIVLSQISEYDDAYDGRYTIKRYHSEKTVTDEGWQHSKVELQPLNPDFDPIELSEDDDVRTIGIFKCVL